MGLFRISRELQFGVCNHSESHASPREGDRGEREIGRAVVNKEAMGFHWRSPCQERGDFLLPVELCYCYVRAPPSGHSTLFIWDFYSLIFYTNVLYAGKELWIVGFKVWLIIYFKKKEKERGGMEGGEKERGRKGGEREKGRKKEKGKKRKNTLLPV